VSVRRADGRHREDHDAYLAGNGLGGRYIPAESIFARADPDWGSDSRRTFEHVKERLDGWTRYDNSNDGGAPLRVEASRPRHDEPRGHDR
jgi:hypothetical protein